MKRSQPKPISPLLQKVINRLIQTGAGEIIITPDNHVFFQPGIHIKALWGAMDMKKEGVAADERIVIRPITKRAKRSKYNGLPMYTIYSLPIVKKNASTMTEAERRNIEINTQALRLAHAVERDPEQLAAYTKLHNQHKLDTSRSNRKDGYKKFYPNLFGFLVATFCMQLAAQQAQQHQQDQTAEKQQPMATAMLPKCPMRAISISASPSYTAAPVRFITPAFNTGNAPVRRVARHLLTDYTRIRSRSSTVRQVGSAFLSPTPYRAAA